MFLSVSSNKDFVFNLYLSTDHYLKPYVISKKYKHYKMQK